MSLTNHLQILYNPVCSKELDELLPLIHMLVLFTHREQFLKHTKTRLLQFTSIHQLSVSLQEMHHQFLFVIVFGWIAIIGLNEFNHLVVPCLPALSLSHTL